MALLQQLKEWHYLQQLKQGHHLRTELKPYSKQKGRAIICAALLILIDSSY